MPTQLSASQFLLESVLEESFGLPGFRPKQQDVIEAVLSGKHVLALLPTGYGKSLCYQLPSQILPGTSIVVSPLISLMQDQLNALWRRGIRNATGLNSNLGLSEQEERFRQIKSGAAKLVYVAPERFESAKFRELLKSIEISLMVIDEAHCISHWGHDFRLQYRNLSSYLTSFNKTSILALTATATPHVQKDIVKTLGLPRMQIISASFDRPNLHFSVRALNSTSQKEEHLLSLLRDGASAIVYTSSRKESERIAGLINTSGLPACFYHAGLSPSERQSKQRQFESGRFPIMVSTVAFGMGIDKSDVRRVIHFNLPPSLENYYQEAGRAGRDGKKADCVLLYQPKDLSTQKWLVSKNYPSREELVAILAALQKAGLNAKKPQELASSLGINETALMSGLSVLKEQQIIDSTPDGAYFERGAPNSSEINLLALERRKTSELARLEKVIAYVQNTRCRRELILDYFAQVPLNACRACDNCN